MATCVLALLVIVAQPVASSAWLGGAHATPGQVALHEAAVQHGQPHHGASAHRAQAAPPRGDAETAARHPVSALGSEFASAAPQAGTFQALLQTLLHATLDSPPDATPPGEAPRGASLVGGLPSQHSPPVPHRPPISLLPNTAIL